MALADEIGKALAPLIGLRWSLARHSGMTIFHFGEVRPLGRALSDSLRYTSNAHGGLSRATESSPAQQTTDIPLTRI
jgi:hypothetical protein